MEEYFGVVPCTIMSMMSNNLLPRPAKSMYANHQHARLALASQTPSACSTGTIIMATIQQGCLLPLQQSPKHFFQDVRMDYQEIIAGPSAKIIRSALSSPRETRAMSFARFSTDDTAE